MKHTPGPWWRAQNACGAYEIGACDQIIATVKINPISHGYKCGGSDSANARLITAAPELLSVLRQAAEWFEPTGSALTYYEKAALKMVTTMRAAIAKAEGGES